MSINQQNINEFFFISIKLLSPDKKLSKVNVTYHYEITLATNKNNFGPFSNKKFIDVTKHIYYEVETFVDDIVKVKIVEYINNELKEKFHLLRNLNIIFFPN